MKVLTGILLAIVLMSSVYASSKTLDRRYIGSYQSVARSTDCGKTWLSFGEFLGEFNDSYLVLQDGFRIDYKRVVTADYESTHYTFIQLNFDDIIEITRWNNTQFLVQYLQNGKEVERCICFIRK